MAKPTLRRCRNCKFLDVPARRDGKVIPRSGECYPCTAPLPDLATLIAMHNLPDSVVTTLEGGAIINRGKWPPHSSYMEPDDGENCVAWRALGKEEPQPE